jgi:hypothetical protein
MGGAESSTGKGGSMARFCVSGDILYVVDNNTLKTFGISDPKKPVFYENRTEYLNFGVETIFPMDTLLFIGSQIGMYIYDISKPQPQLLSSVWHITSCDPVVANGKYAYVTLNSNNIRCGVRSNMLQIYDISNLRNPECVKEIRLTSPLGLGIDGNKLFICDRGLKVYDLTDPESPQWMEDNYSANVDVTNAYDVIPVDGLLILVASNGIFQFDYTGQTLKFLSKIETVKQ